jgi:DNA-binding MarR family transcriptional regulator
MLREFASRLKNSNAALEEFTHRRTQMLILLQILDQPKATVDEHIEQISRLTRKEPSQIRNIFQELSGQGIVRLRDNRPDIDRDKMWSMFDSGI